MFSFIVFHHDDLISSLVLDILGSYEWIFDVEQDDPYKLPDKHTLDIGMSGPYEQISYELQGYLSELLDSHTLDIGISGPYEPISDA